MTARLLVSLSLGLAATAAPCTAYAQTETYAIRGGSVHTLAGPVVDGGTVVVQDGRITAVGSSVTVPAGAQVIDATGLRVYPGIFNAFSQLGLQEINAVAVTNDVMELGDFNPHLAATTAVHPASERIPVTRANGVTHVVAAPSARAGGIGGQACFDQPLHTFEVAVSRRKMQLACGIRKARGRHEPENKPDSPFRHPVILHPVENSTSVLPGFHAFSSLPAVRQ